MTYETITIDDLPPGTQVRGALYSDPTIYEGPGDVLEVELTTGIMIDVAWDGAFPSHPYRLTVYREYFGDWFVTQFLPTADDVAAEVRRMARDHAAGRPLTRSMT